VSVEQPEHSASRKQPASIRWHRNHAIRSEQRTQHVGVAQRVGDRQLDQDARGQAEVDTNREDVATAHATPVPMTSLWFSSACLIASTSGYVVGFTALERYALREQVSTQAD
jgi:hypothetical protein